MTHPNWQPADLRLPGASPVPGASAQPPQRRWYLGKITLRSDEQRAQAMCEAVARLAAFDELVLGITEIKLASGVPNRIPRRYRAPKQLDRTWLDTGPARILVKPLLFCLSAVGSVADGIAELLIDGLLRLISLFEKPEWSGGWDSMAGRFIIAVRTGHPNDAGHQNNEACLALTDRRLLLLHHARVTGRRHDPAGLLLQTQRNQVALRQSAKPHPIRVDLAFGDGSWVALRSWTEEVSRLVPLFG